MTETLPRLTARDRKLFWLGIIGAPLIWSLHLLASYAVISLACVTGAFAIEPFTLGSLILLALTLIAVLVTAGAGYKSYQRWQALRGDLAHNQRTVSQFLALLTVFSSGLFGFIVLISGLAAIFYRYPC